MEEHKRVVILQILAVINIVSFVIGIYRREQIQVREKGIHSISENGSTLTK